MSIGISGLDKAFKSSYFLSGFPFSFWLFM